ncbi:MAG: hypothetical protein ACOX9R_12665 [Armatimonadota bacterium]
MMTRLLTITLALGLLAIGCSAEPPTRDELGREVKLTILVDKVLQPVAGWKTEEWMIEETAEAGFNVFSPRRGYDDLEAVRQVTEWCEQYGIYHQVWMRGTLGVPEGADAEGRMLVWRTGGEQPIYSPNADEFWEWTTRWILEYARISAENPHLIGVFLDYENYASGPRMSGTVYDLSYDQMTLDMFSEAEGVEIPALAPAERYQWLVDNDLHEAFDAWQVGHWRERARALREAVDAIDPDFQFCMYPAPGSRLMLEAAFPEWTNERAPVIFADAVTYGRRTSFLPQDGALAEGRRALTARMESVAEMGLPFIYTGGIDPVVAGADPEYSGKNAVMISDVTDGYWIFYEGPRYDTTHPEYFHWFTWANEAIAGGDFARQHEPRETPDPWAFAGIGTTGEPGFGPSEEAIGPMVELPTVHLRRRNLLMVAGKAGQEVVLEMNTRQIGATAPDLEWEVRDMTWAEVASGVVPFGEAGAISFTPEQDGIYALVMLVGGSPAYTIAGANAPVALYAGRGLGIVYGAERLYFHVPEGLERFTIGGRGFGAETVRVNVYDPEGNLAGSAQTTPTQTRLSVEVEVGDGGGQTWALELTEADEGAFEDMNVELGEGLPPALSLTPEHVFMAK